jgi:hypothetical protein
MTSQFVINIEAVGRAVHEVNRAYCISVGDTSQVSWEEAPQWQRDSVLPQVLAVLNGATPKKLHDMWMQHKKQSGWKYGPVKDAEKKEHPCMMPYNDLPEIEKVKDMLFHSTVKSVMKALEVNIRNGIKP